MSIHCSQLYRMPDWYEEVIKLPKDCKWSDGTKVHKKGDKRYPSETYYFLIVDNYIYIKNVYKYFAYPKSNEEINEITGNVNRISATWYRWLPGSNLIGKVNDFRKLTIREIASKFGQFSSVFFINQLMNFLHNNGLEMGYVVSIFRKEI